MGIALLTAPTTEPFTTAEAKLHLRVDHSTEDTYIDNLVKAARHHVENVTNYQLLTATWALTMDRFPRCGEVTRYVHDMDILVPKYPIQSVTSLEYTDTAGLTQELTLGTHYQISTGVNPQRLQLLYDQSWPDIRGDKLGIVFTFVAGYTGTSLIPAAIRQAMLQIIAHWYWHRGEETQRDIPRDAEALLEPYTWTAGL